MTNYQRLLTDPDARRILLCEVTYYNGTTTQVLRRGSDAWTSGRSDTPVDLHFAEGLEADLNVEVGIDSGATLGGVATPEYGVLTFPNKSGDYDSFKVGVSVDGYDVRLLYVGRLADGTDVSYAEAAASPVFVGVGMGRPLVSSSKMEIGIKGDLYRFDRPLCTRFYSPPCPHFPGAPTDYIDFGDVLDRSGSFCLEFWIKTEDPTLAGQLVVSKDTGTAGWYIDIGTAGAGAVRFGIREQTPATSDTMTGIIKIGQDHQIAVVWDASAGKRYIYVDRTLLVTTTVTAGVPAGNAADLLVGKGFKGTISRGRFWSTARTLAQIDANMLLPMLGTGVSHESGLDELLNLDEGRGGASWGGKVGSGISGALTSGVTWVISTWCGSSLVGQRVTVVVGKALDVQLAPVDPSRNCFGTSWPPPIGVPAVRSNHNALAGGTYSVDYRGFVFLNSAPGGTMSADIQGETAHNGAVHFDGSTGFASGTVTCPAGSMSLGIMMYLEDASITRCLVNFRQSASNIGLRGISIGNTRVAYFEVGNDAGTRFFVLTSSALPLNAWVELVGALDTVAGAITIYANGLPVGSATVSGTFNTTVTSFALARRAQTASDFFQGSLDGPTVWANALGQGNAEALTVAPAVAGSTYLRHHWTCDEGAGSTLGNAVIGGPSITLNGTTSWTQSRIAPADIVTVLATRYGGYGKFSVLFDGTTGYAAGTVPCPPGSMSIHCWALASSSVSTRRRIAGWDAGGGAGCRQLEFLSGATNFFQFRVVNDQGATFTCFINTPMTANVWSSVLAVLDVAGGQMLLYQDGFFGGAGSSTAISGTFNTVSTSFALGRSSSSAADFLPGGVDAVSLYSAALGATDALNLRSGLPGTYTAFLTQLWDCDEGQGRALNNSAPGGAPLTLQGGFTWRPGGSPAGNTLTAPGIDTSAAAAYIRQISADSGWAWSDNSTVRDAANLVLTGLHSYLVPDPVSRNLVMKQVQGPTGTPDALADFDDGDLPAKSDIQPANEKFGPPVYRIVLGYAYNNNVMTPDRLAGIVTSQPDRYQFGQRAWRAVQAQNLVLLDAYPQAFTIPPVPTDGSEQQPIPTVLLNQPDCQAEANRVLPFYQDTEERDVFVIRTSGMGTTVGTEMQVTATTGDGVGRLGMGPPGKSYRVIHAKRVNNRVTATGWRF